MCLTPHSAHPHGIAYARATARTKFAHNTRAKNMCRNSIAWRRFAHRRAHARMLSAYPRQHHRWGCVARECALRDLDRLRATHACAYRILIHLFFARCETLASTRAASFRYGVSFIVSRAGAAGQQCHNDARQRRCRSFFESLSSSSSSSHSVSASVSASAC